MTSPVAQASAALLKIRGAATQEDHPANTGFQQLLQCSVAEFPAGIAPLPVTRMATGSDHQQLGNSSAAFS